jgi:hypothetical protein
MGLETFRKSQCTVPVMLTGGRCARECDGEQVAAPAGHTRPSQSQGTVCLIQMLLHREIIYRGVEGLYFKRPIQCLASSKTLTPHPLTALRVCTPLPLVRGEDNPLGGEGVGGQYFGRRQTLLCTLHM